MIISFFFIKNTNLPSLILYIRFWNLFSRFTRKEVCLFTFLIIFTPKKWSQSKKPDQITRKTTIPAGHYTFCDNVKIVKRLDSHKFKLILHIFNFESTVCMQYFLKLQLLISYFCLLFKNQIMNACKNFWTDSISLTLISASCTSKSTHDRWYEHFETSEREFIFQR